MALPPKYHHDIVMFSGGLGSWAAAKLRRKQFPDHTMKLVFADTRFEDPDLYGFGPEETGRVERNRQRWQSDPKGWTTVYPVHEAGMTNAEVRAWAEREGLTPPGLYDDGFEHNNCKGGCIKAGVGQFVHLLKTRPDTYREWEDGERRVMAAVGSTQTILRDRTGGETRPLSLTVLRQRVEAGETGLGVRYKFACGCFSGEDDG